ncbi:DNA-binding GntR family transcriptional regulator [Streptomyces sp. SAI-133]|jgi:DNA-binding GntR family transcriptional regulator|uniref:GntR family transcriptional regulator n=1 Tax=unclassified Streptomyces TaxID=2593676 RepID=UPI002474C097|nr:MULTISPECIES: GntR family transcriptional regulator [unclassified Streptomyces]MDH6554444.1 DNA-binding GntR family transcriptional regulator [Streptomyces sp. SAI-041]MDH6581558.1 DNA-binding GntR family transcriptional regulator [Streptomyces sp. SAI-133]
MIERPDNLTDLVFAAIRDRIVSASLPPGSSVSEATLAKELTVSKTPVREALLRMRRIGLVEPTSRGLRVTLASARSVREAFEYRAVLEADAAVYASHHATIEQLEAIANWAARTVDCARSGDSAGFRQADQEFHVAVANASGNEYMRAAIEDAFVLTVALRQRDVSLVRDLVPDALEHLEIAHALRGRDSAAASALLSGHALRIMDQLLDAMTQHDVAVTAG